ncbi:putative arabinogalactan endo-beta-1,4-galactanase A [Clarias magur]|uniref:Putative arabinogalactan endo-beta-1,4-galactanase A n=1 Tax=Clarias magur TaxID=1594786 RepID=A0A8J4TD58_CLAMG|nr:putative arabinogalactan endo-beta-1,4-galactanase A [Clarias magur]
MSRDSLPVIFVHSDPGADWDAQSRVEDPALCVEALHGHRSLGLVLAGQTPAHASSPPSSLI